MNNKMWGKEGGGGVSILVLDYHPIMEVAPLLTHFTPSHLVCQILGESPLLNEQAMEIQEFILFDIYLPSCALLNTYVKQHLPQYWRSKWLAINTPAPQDSDGHSRRRRVIFPFSSTL